MPTLDRSLVVDTRRWYRDNDITEYLNLALADLGGHRIRMMPGADGAEIANTESYLLQNEFTDEDGVDYLVAVTPAIDTLEEASPIAMYLNKLDQQAPDPGRQDSRRDVFDEIMPAIAGRDPAHVKILFPFNITNSHWLTGEIIIHRAGNNFRIEIYAHNPYGKGKMGTDNYSKILAVVTNKIRETYHDAEINAENGRKKSPFRARQASEDAVSCGVITARDILERVQGRTLNRAEGVYPVGAEELRRSHLNLFVNRLPGDNLTRRNFIRRNTDRRELESHLILKLPSFYAFHKPALPKVKDKLDNKKFVAKYFERLSKRYDFKISNSSFEDDGSIKYVFASRSDLEKFNTALLSQIENIKSIFNQFLTDAEKASLKACKPQLINDSAKYILLIEKEFAELITKAARCKALATIGRKYIDKEQKEDQLEGFSDEDLLRLIKEGIASAKSNPAHSRSFLGLIGLCAHELQKRKSMFCKENTGIPWRAISYLHRVLSGNARETKSLPHIHFTEGIYYDEKLTEEALKRIISVDLDELDNAIDMALADKIYQQRFPVANHIQLMYQFYYSESHLQFLRHACEGILNSKGFENLDSDKKFQDMLQRCYFIYIINIGEAFNFMPAHLLKYFNPEIVKSFKDERNLLAHPEREDNRAKIDDLLEGRTTIYDLLKIKKEDLIEQVDLIYDIAIGLLRKDYNYMFDVDVNEVASFPEGFKGDIKEIPVSTLNIFFAVENLAMSNGRMRVAFKPRPVDEILDCSLVIDNFNSTVVSLVESGRDYNMPDCIAYLRQNYEFHKSTAQKPKEILTPEEVKFLEDYTKVKEITKKRLCEGKSSGDMNYQLQYLYQFLSLFNKGDKEFDKIFGQIKNKLISNFEGQKEVRSDQFTIERLQEIVSLAEKSLLILGGALVDHQRSGIKSVLKYLKTEIKTKKQQEEMQNGLNSLSLESDDNLFENDSSSSEPDGNEDKTDQATLQEFVRDAKIAEGLIKQIDRFFSQFYMMYHNFYQITKREDGIRGAISKIVGEQIWGPVIWYYTILLGSLSRNLLGLNLIKISEISEFKKFFEDNFQIPRGDIAHNQVSLIGDQEYISATEKLQKNIKKGNRTIDGEYFVRESGEVELTIKHRKHLPAADLPSGTINENQHVQDANIKICLFARVGKTIHTAFNFVREKSGKMSMRVYLLDEPYRENEESIGDLKKRSFLTIAKNHHQMEEYFASNLSLDASLRKNSTIGRIIKEVFEKIFEQGAGGLTIHFGPFFMHDKLVESIEETRTNWAESFRGKKDSLRQSPLIKPSNRLLEQAKPYANEAPPSISTLNMASPLTGRHVAALELQNQCRNRSRSI